MKNKKSKLKTVTSIFAIFEYDNETIHAYVIYDNNTKNIIESGYDYLPNAYPILKNYIFEKLTQPFPSNFCGTFYGKPLHLIQYQKQVHQPIPFKSNRHITQSNILQVAIMIILIILVFIAFNQM